MDDYNKLCENVEKAEKALEIAKTKLKGKNRKKIFSPEEIVEEMERMIGCQDWPKHPTKKLGETLVKNLFRNRDIEEQKWRDQQRDY